MKQFEWTSSGHDSLRGMLGSSHFPRLTSTAEVVLEEFDSFDADDMLLLRERVQIPYACMI